MNRKTIASFLDAAASRAEIVNARPASGKQVWYLAGLMAERGLGLDWADCGACNTQATLTSRKCSLLIDEALKLDKVAA